MESPADEYAKKIQSGQIPANRFIKLAVDRYFNDLENCHSRGFYFDESRAWHAINFFNFIKHWKGSFAGKPFILSPFQHFIVWNIFGWIKEDGFRRYQTAYIEMPRKNGKTGLAAGIELYMLFADGEYGAEVYSVATKKDQAKLSFTDAKKYVNKSPHLKKRCISYINNISVPDFDSKFEPLGADEDTLDGLNTHCGVIDELHAHKSAGVVDLISTSTGARDQPLIFEITTAGKDVHSICFQHREYSINILEQRGGFEDDSWFAMIFGIDDEKEWKDPEKWGMANPNLDISIKSSYMRKEFKKALVMRSYENTFKRLHLGIWTEGGEKWIPDEKWQDNKSNYDLFEKLKGRECFAGLDLAKNFDMNAFVLYFPDGEKHGYLMHFFFCPEDVIKLRSENRMTPYEKWVESGHLIETPGNVRDDDFIINYILDLGRRFNILSIAYDDWGAPNIASKLQEQNVTMSEFRQGYRSMSAPTKEFEKRVIGKQIEHDGNPFMRWMMGNVVITYDPAENQKINKEKSRRKVDGPVAAVMALGEYMTFNPPPENPYEDRGVISI